MRRALRWLGRVPLAVLAMFLVVLAVSNRDRVTFSLFPLPYELEMPLYVLLLLVFVAGVVVAYFTAARRLWRLNRLLHQTRARVQALEVTQANHVPTV